MFCVGLLIAVLSSFSFIPAQHLLRSESLAAMFHYGWFEAVCFIGLLAPLAAALSALMMAIAIRCKTFKEAQANSVVLTLAVSLMPLISLFNQEGESAWNLWMPALAQTTLMNRVLKNAPIALVRRCAEPGDLRRAHGYRAGHRQPAVDEARGAIGTGLEDALARRRNPARFAFRDVASRLSDCRASVVTNLAAGLPRSMGISLLTAR